MVTIPPTLQPRSPLEVLLTVSDGDYLMLLYTDRGECAHIDVWKDGTVVVAYDVIPHRNERNLHSEVARDARQYASLALGGKVRWPQEAPLGRQDVVEPQPEVGSLYLDYEGNAYRLVGYVRRDDWDTTEYPIYTRLLVGSEGAAQVGAPHRMAKTAHMLPEGARLIWSPTGGPR